MFFKQAGVATGAARDLEPPYAQVESSAKRIPAAPDFDRHPSIAAKNPGMNDCDMTLRLLREAGFGSVSEVASKGPAAFGVFEAGVSNSSALFHVRCEAGRPGGMDFTAGCHEW
jgi:hypothetical protein